MRYAIKLLILLLLSSGSGLLAQQAAPPPTLKIAGTTTRTPAAATPTPAKTRGTARPRPSKELLDQKWPAPNAVVDVPAVIDTKEAELRAKFEKARSFLVEKKPADALPILMDAERLDPDRLEIQQMLGVCLAMLGRFDDASRAFQKAVKIAPKSAESHFGLCQTMADASRPIEAIDECREAVRLGPKQAAFKRGLAEIYLRTESYQEAAILLEQSVDAQKSLVSTGLLGDAYFMSGEYFKASQMYERIALEWPDVSLAQFRLSSVYDYLDRPADSISAARKFAELEPKLIAAHLNLGEKLQQNGFFHESIEALKKATGLDPNSLSAARLLSENYSILGDRDSALGSLRIAYRQLPRSPGIALALGQALVENRMGSEAVEPLEFAKRAEPDNAEILRALAFAYIANRRYDEANALFDRANQLSPLPSNISIKFPSSQERDQQTARFDETLAFVKKNPTNVDARRYLAKIYELKDMPAEAEKQYLELIKLSPDDFAIYNELSIFYGENRQQEKALDAIRNAIRLKAHHVFYMSLSWQLQKLGRLDEAIEAAAKAVEIKPDSLECRLGYGELLLKKGLRADALREYQAGFQVASGDVRPNFRLAWLYIQMGSKEGALRHYAILKGIAPNELKWLELSLRAHFGTLT